MMWSVYTDGSCSPNPGPGGAGVVILRNDKLVAEITHNGGDTTNNRMELYAVIMALDFLPKDEECIVYTDSNYVKQGLNRWIHGWIKRDWVSSNGKAIKNVDLWRTLYRKRQEFPLLTIEWIKAHAGNKWNERADYLAKSGLDLFQS